MISPSLSLSSPNFIITVIIISLPPIIHTSPFSTHLFACCFNILIIFSSPFSDDGRGELDNNNRDGGRHSSPFWHRLNRVITRLCSTHQFKNLQVEMLYQRYFLRMNQNNTTHIVSLLLALVLLLASIHVVFALLVAHSANSHHSSAASETSSSTAAASASSPLGILGMPVDGGDSSAKAALAAIASNVVLERWKNETKTTTTVKGDEVDGIISDNSNLTVSSNMTMWEGQNETITMPTETTTISDDVGASPQLRHPRKMSNYLAPNNILALITLGICGTICICTYPGWKLNGTEGNRGEQDFDHRCWWSCRVVMLLW